jgi:Pentapeptide repeats (8 copies)
LSDAVLRDADLRDADLRDADLSDAVLSGAVLSGAVLSEQKNDFWEILLRSKKEVPYLRAAIVDGKVDGSTYEGECACLVGTISKARGVDYQSMSGISPNASRPAERWFMGIKKGDTPETNQISKITLEWLDEFVSLVEA